MGRTRRRSGLVVLAVALLVPAVAWGDTELADAQRQGWLYAYAAVFGAGFVTSLTPCVYPMIPITLAIFGARGGNVSRSRSIALATTYVLGMGVTYALLGVLFATVFGVTGFGSQLKSPYVIYPLVFLFVLFAASMFGAFQMSLPQGFQNRLNQIGGKGYRGAFAMGTVGGLIASPCTGPFLGSVLAFTATTSVVGGGSLLFVYALGMGVLFFVLAASASALPKSGPWMDAVKSLSGIFMLLAAIYFLRPEIPWMRTFAPPDAWFLAAMIGTAVVGIAIGALHLSFHGTTAERVRKAVGIVLVVAGLFGVWSWKMTPKKRLPWRTDEAAAYAEARQAGKGVMVDFSASWCIPCEELELVFGDDEVYDAILARFIPLKFDVSESSAADQALQARYDSTTLPSVLFVDSTGTVLDHSIRSLIDRDDMLARIKAAAEKLRQAGLPPHKSFR